MVVVVVVGVVMDGTGQISNRQAGEAARQEGVGEHSIHTRTSNGGRVVAKVQRVQLFVSSDSSAQRDRLRVGNVIVGDAQCFQGAVIGLDGGREEGHQWAQAGVGDLQLRHLAVVDHRHDGFVHFFPVRQPGYMPMHSCQ